MKRSTAHRREVLGLAIGLFLVAIAMAGALVSSYQLWYARDRVSHTLRVRSKLTLLLSQIQDAEAGQRGYLITGDVAHLQPYHNARAQVAAMLDRLARMTSDDASQQARVAALRPLIEARLANLGQSIELEHEEGYEAAAQRIRSGVGSEIMRQIRELIAQADGHEARLIAAREARALARWRWLVASALAGWSVGTVLVVMAALYAQRSWRVAQGAQRQFRALFESAPGAYLVLEPGRYQIVAVSDAYLSATMTRREEILGKTLFEVFPDDPADAQASGTRNLRASLQRVQATGRSDAMAVQHYPIRRRPADGGGFEQRWWSPLNSPVFGPDGELVYIIHRVEDVTPLVNAQQSDEPASEVHTLDRHAQHLMAAVLLRGQELQRANEQLRQSEEQLRRTNRELADFATIVSHDLKSPLRGVATLASWLRSDYQDKLDDQGREQLTQMVHRLRRMDRMVNEILEYARLGRREGRVMPVPLLRLVRDVVQDLASHQARVELAPDMPTVLGDPIRLRQVFQNLIGNAIKHNDHPHPWVGVTWADVGSDWKLLVADNGPGVEPRHETRIFRMFQTLAPSGTSDSTGVGLALVKRIVELAGGRVWVEPHTAGGSVFCFTWPKTPVGHDKTRTGAGQTAADGPNLALHQKEAS
jgi:signal transduction histidine kinase/CHASE3 domain sensor protein